ncbi:hypothetical protein ISS05_01785 [Candidatus Woesearchaeota archaeon]|nr:hypothetical protein [Candidatus Woesearchaeota archaeon]
MKVKTILVLCAIIIFISGCGDKEVIEQKKTGLTYENQELGISFQYPSDFKVYQQDEDTLKIDSPYKDPVAILLSISMTVKRISLARDSLDQIEARINPEMLKSMAKEFSEIDSNKMIEELKEQKKQNFEAYQLMYGDETPEEATANYMEMMRDISKTKEYEIQNKGDYDLIIVEGGADYYILSDGGTFYISDTLQVKPWREKLEGQGLYEEYRSKFDNILDSIKII